MSIDPPVAQAIGVTPGNRRDFETSNGSVSVAWALSEPAAPNMGSIRRLAKAAGVRLGDSLVLIFDPNEGVLRAERGRHNEAV
ncbi:hypothetical protein OS121_12470 [Mycolicibacterium mucogenicum]|uniref:hypothetical protein n=1 Tax=Mycolicibacterium mucogenicum TaxID=56689 RepID=UPI00226A681F|nr:hypothetical protein [Mycolicibacterium mucogenicum]MCX8555901.1 hypothetical protein [Mycolicibacterium mucogenicum]